jgi:hypothetical protein
MFGMLACGNADQVAAKAGAGIQAAGKQISELPGSIRDASPYIKEDLERLWNQVAGDIEVYAQGLGIEEPSHQLAEANEAREKLISGESFEEVLRIARNELTKEDLENMPSSDLNVLNGILPFEIDLTKCGENLAEVLNSLDIGQVSAVLRSERGFHIIQLIDRNGGRVRIGHIMFEVDPAIETAPADESADEDTPDPVADAIAKLTRAIQGQ